ncbi:MAG: hypothetical protein GY767_01440 [Shimia sp.]|nr:hypothetical protein [Shimia sp.]MCP4824587.1 hypothetical protein [Shimia sp.]
MSRAGLMLERRQVLSGLAVFSAMPSLAMAVSANQPSEALRFKRLTLPRQHVETTLRALRSTPQSVSQLVLQDVDAGDVLILNGRLDGKGAKRLEF